MQTFVPYGPKLALNAKVLDYRRLGKQRVEAYQIINALTGLSKGWTNHPATRMWSGHVPALALYGAHMCLEWKLRGYKDSLLPVFEQYITDTNQVLPEWLYRDDVQLSHRSNLIRKDPDFYRPMWPDTPSDMPYVWPV